MDFSKSDIAKGAEISRASLFNYWNELEKLGIVRVTRSFGKTKLYTLNSKNPVTQKIIDLEKTLIAEAMSKVGTTIAERRCPGRSWNRSRRSNATQRASGTVYVWYDLVIAEQPSRKPCILRRSVMTPTKTDRS